MTDDMQSVAPRRLTMQHHVQSILPIEITESRIISSTAVPHAHTELQYGPLELQLCQKSTNTTTDSYFIVFRIDTFKSRMEIFIKSFDILSFNRSTLWFMATFMFNERHKLQYNRPTYNKDYDCNSCKYVLSAKKTNSKSYDIVVYSVCRSLNIYPRGIRAKCLNLHTCV